MRKSPIDTEIFSCPHTDVDQSCGIELNVEVQLNFNESFSKCWHFSLLLDSSKPSNRKTSWSLDVIKFGVFTCFAFQQLLSLENPLFWFVDYPAPLNLFFYVYDFLFPELTTKLITFTSQWTLSNNMWTTARRVLHGQLAYHVEVS